MKALFAATMIMAFLILCSNGMQAQTTQAKLDHKVLLFIKDGSPQLEYMLIHEVGTMNRILKESGFEVAIATVSGEVLKTDSITMTPNLKLDEVNIKDYAGFIFPCMASNTIQTEAVAFVKKIANEGKPIAAQIGGVLILGEAGVLKGKKFAFKDEKDSNPSMYPMLNDGIYSGRGVIKDGNIITSGTCPLMEKVYGYKDGTTELTRMLIDAAKVSSK
jgi:putative intracellular protease/amidase